MKKQKKNKRFDFVTLALSILAGLLWAFIGRILIQQLYGHLWMPLLMGLYFFGLALMLIFVTWICTQIKGRLMPEKGSYLKAFALALIIFLIAGAFQWIYSLDFQWKNSSGAESTRDTAFIFLIDESGSMVWNDPNHERVTAIRELLAACDPDFPYAVYGFGTEPRLISLIQPASAAANSPLQMTDDGLTNISDAIQFVAEDIQLGILKAGARPHVILVTDGKAEGSSIFSLAEALQYAKRANIRVSTVGVGDAVDQDYLTDIAIKTGGNYINCANMSELLSGMTNVTKLETTTNYQRTLLNKRENMQNDWIYATMRILFLLMLAFPFMLIKSLLLRTNDVEANVFLPNLIMTLIGALSVEVAMNQFLLRFFKELTVQNILCVGFTALIVTELAHQGHESDLWDDSSYGFDNHSGLTSYDSGDDDGFD